MLSVDANEMEMRSSESLVVPKIRKSKSRTMSKLEKAGKNDSVKSSYSLSVFIDPNASKDMGRQEELWYTMYEPERSEGDLDKNRLVSENEMERLKSKDLRNGFESVASVNSQQTSDNERFFRENAVTVGAGTGGAPGKNSEGDPGGFRGNSIATHEEDVEVTGDENAAEEEAMRTHRELLAQAPRQGHRQHGTSSSAASEASEDHNHLHPRDYARDLREDAEHTNSDSGTEGVDDDQGNEWQTGRQSDAVNYSRSHPEYDENADGQRPSEVRTSTGQGHSGENSVNEGGAAAYQSSMQGRHSTGYLRQRTGSGKGAPVDDVNSRILTKRIGIDYRDNIENAEEENMYLTLTLSEGSDEDPYARSTHRQVAKGRRRIARAAPAEAGGAPGGGDTRPTRYESLGGSTSVNSAPRNNHSSAAAHDDDEFSSSQRRKRNPIAKRERIQRTTTTTQGEAQDSNPDGAATPTEHPSNYVRASSDDDDDDEAGQLNSLSGRPMPASRTKSSRSGADSVQRPAQMYSSEEEYDDDSVRRRQGTNRGETEEAGRFSRQTASDEENERYEVVNRGRDTSTNRRSTYSTSSSRNTSDAHDYEMYSPNAQRDLRKNTYYDSNNATQNDYRPRPTQRTKIGIQDSLSSMDYSSSNEVYHPKTYNQRNVKARSTKDGSADNQLSYQSFEDQSSRNTGYAQGMGFYPDSALGPPIQPRKGVRQNPARVADNSSESSLSQEQRSQFRRRPIVNDQVLYSDDSESDDHSTRTGQKVVVDFASESDSSSSVPDETERRRKSRTTTTTKTTVVRKTATPVRGVLTVDETASPQPSPRTVRREIRTVTTPVTGVVSVDDSAVAYRNRNASPMTRTTPVEGLISVHRQHHSRSRQERTKTPVVGLITPRESQTQSVLRSSTVVTPVRGVINVGRTPSPERSKTPIVGLISTRRPLSSASMNQPTMGDINVITSRSARNRPTISSSMIKSDINDNSYYRQSHVHPRQVKYSLNTSIDSVLVPTTPDSKEIVGVDPELRRAQKTGTNYRITMNLRPVIDDLSDVGYEMHNTRVMRSATPNSAARSYSRRATDWDLSSEYLRSGSRASNPMTMGNTLQGSSRRSVSRTPSNQFVYESNTNARFGPYSAWEGNAFPARRRSSSLYQERVVRPDSQSTYQMDYGRGDTLTDPRAWVNNRPATFQELSRHASSITERSRPRSMAEQRHDLHFSQPQVVNLKPIHQTVTSRPIRNVGQDRLTVKGSHERAFNGLPKSHSSSMSSSVFMSPTLDRRLNRNAQIQSNFRNDDTYQRLGHFN